MKGQRQRANLFADLAGLAKQRVDDAERHLRDLNAGKARSEERLRMLAEYRDTHAAQGALAEGTPLDLDRMRNRHRFIAKLDAAVDQQRAEVTHWQSGVERGRNRWRDEWKKMHSFDSLRERVEVELKRAEERHEQKATDEAAARRTAHSVD